MSQYEREKNQWFKQCPECGHRLIVIHTLTICSENIQWSEKKVCKPRRVMRGA